MSTAPATRLDQDTLARLRREAVAANARDGGFVDPARMRAIQSWWRPELGEWAAAVTGLDHVASLDRLPWRDWLLLDLAHAAEPAPPPPPRLTAQRQAAAARQVENDRARAAEADARLATWRRVVEALAAKDISVRVAHNYSSRHHYEGYVQGVEHIVVLAELHHGRLNRDARQALCESPSRRRHLEFPHLDDPLDRWPTCRACVRIACRIAELPDSTGVL
jgi:hypothetical protein